MTDKTHRIETLDSLREILGFPGLKTEKKICDRLDETAREFIARSPFFLFATADAAGDPDVSPKGDPAGFVHIEDDRTLLIPERKGNNLIFGLQNMLDNPTVALIFLVPGTEETLRVHGTVELLKDPELCARLSARGQPALLVIRLRITRCYFHCAKAFKRAALWDPSSWPPQVKVSFGKIIAANSGGDAAMAEEFDRYVEEVSYKTRL